MQRGKDEAQVRWHPDFRLEATLPDIKLIRTGFTINFLAFIVLVSVAGVVAQREYRAYHLRDHIGALEQRIHQAKASDAQFLELSARFADMATRAEEVAKFYNSPIIPHEFLAQLFQSCPAGFAFDGVYLREYIQKRKDGGGVVYSIEINARVRELAALTAFKRSLRSAEGLGFEGYSVEITETDTDRNTDTGIFSCQVKIEIRAQDRGRVSRQTLALGRSVGV